MNHPNQGTSIYRCRLAFFAEKKIEGQNSQITNPLSYGWQSVFRNKTLVTAGMPAHNIYSNELDLVKIEVEIIAEPARPNIIRLRKTTDVPAKVLFYASHFTIDLLEQVASSLQSDSLTLLLDSDVIATKTLSENLLNRCTWAGMGAFNVSDQVFPAYGTDRVIHDLEVVAGRTLLNPKWYGGEALIAALKPLQKLVRNIRDYYLRYPSALGTLHHEGDEAFISAAFKTSAEDSGEIIETDAYQATGRHWAGHTHRNFRWFESCALLHSPGNETLFAREGHRARFDK